MEKIKITMDDVKKCYIDLVKQYGKDGKLFTFEYCSNYGLSLDNNTIDEIQVFNDDICFVYNANNNNDFNYFEHFYFNMEDLIDFYNGLIDAIEDENREDN